MDHVSPWSYKSYCSPFKHDKRRLLFTLAATIGSEEVVSSFSLQWGGWHPAGSAAAAVSSALDRVVLPFQIVERGLDSFPALSTPSPSR